jgi:hypothetical protein
MAETTIPPLPSAEEQARAKWDLLLNDIELRMEEIRQLKGAKWDLLLRDLELRAEQVRQIKTFEGWRLLFAGMTATAAVFAAGGVVGGLLVRLLAGYG